MKLPKQWHRIIQATTYILIGMTIVAAAYILWQWYESGGGFEVLYVVIGGVLGGLWWLNRYAVK